MEKLTDIFKELKSRLSSPLIFSFLISWPIVNWKVVIGLLFYKIEDLKQDHYVSFIDLIQKNYSPCTYYGLPLLIAVFYTFCFPFIRMWIKWFQVWINNKTDKKIHSMTAEITIPMERYIKDRNKYLENTKQLKEVMDKESTYLNENIELQGEKTKLLERIKGYELFNNINFLDGYWDVKHLLDGEKKLERVQFSSGNVFRQGANGKQQEWLKIGNYGINLSSGEILLFFLQANKNPSFISILRYQGVDKTNSKEF